MDQISKKLTDELTGLSIYFPIHSTYYDDKFKDVTDLNAWHDFLGAYYAAGTEDANPPQFTNVDDPNGDPDNPPKDENSTCNNEICDTEKDETPQSCPNDCTEPSDYDVQTCPKRVTTNCNGDYLVDYSSDSPSLSYYGEDKTYGAPYTEPNVPAAPQCVAPTNTAYIQCANDGILSITAPVIDSTIGNTATQYLFYDYIAHTNQSIQIYGHIPAKRNEQKKQIRDH